MTETGAAPLFSTRYEPYSTHHFIRCRRCDRMMPNTEETDYCSQDCELGAVPMPNQTRESQAETLRVQSREWYR